MNPLYIYQNKQCGGHFLQVLLHEISKISIAVYVMCNTNVDLSMLALFLEQYEAFLKFNHDQLHLRFGHSDMSCKYPVVSQNNDFNIIFHHFLHLSSGGCMKVESVISF